MTSLSRAHLPFGDESTPERAVAEIDLGAVRANVRRLRELLGAERELCAVVKADGYGHGALRCAGAAIAEGASRLAVSTAAEAAEIRAVFPQVPLLTMGPLTPAELDTTISCGSEFGVSDPDTLEAASARASALGRLGLVHLKLDTGMSRLGATDPQLVIDMADRIARDSHLRLGGVWTHFATADDHGSDFFDAQLAQFAPVARIVKARYPKITVHAANSAALFRDSRCHFDMARCGIAIYGLDPFQTSPKERGLVPAMALRSYVAQVKPVSSAATIGYGRAWIASGPTNIGLIPIGYADGIRRNASNRAAVLVGGERRRSVGRISMDSLTVDLGTDCDVERKDEAILIGSQGAHTITAEEVADITGTINYEITCGISKRVQRRYRDANDSNSALTP